MVHYKARQQYKVLFEEFTRFIVFHSVNFQKITFFSIQDNSMDYELASKKHIICRNKRFLSYSP